MSGQTSSRSIRTRVASRQFAPGEFPLSHTHPGMQNLRFHPLLKQALWGGTRLATDLGKPVDGLQQIAESWEVSDLPRDVSIVSNGPLHSVSLRTLMEQHCKSLLGRHADATQFPLLIKFLDAQSQLSVQVHPQRPTVLPNGERVWGKAEAWIVLDAAPGSRMYVGLKSGVTERDLIQALDSHTVAECLNVHEPQAGECLLLEPGTVHALGGGILVAEVQLPSDITYRLHDWDRLDAQGRPRQLHRAEALASVKYSLGPVSPVTPQPLNDSTRGGESLLRSAYFHIDRYRGAGPCPLPADGRMHVLVQLTGSSQLGDEQLRRGDVLILPAERGAQVLNRQADSEVLDCFLPDEA